MNFLHPWAAWFLAGLPLIVLLYLMRLKRRSVNVSTHLFWQRALQENSRSALFQRLRNVLSLLLHLLIFSIIVGALARPLFHKTIPADGASTVIILDTRARMQAVEADGKARFEKAISTARELARQAADGRQFALLTLDATPTVTVPFTTDEKTLLEAIEHTSATDASGDVDAAIQLADSLLSARSGEKRIVLLSDRGPSKETTSRIHAPLETRSFGTSLANLAITRLSTRALPASPETHEVLLEVQNFGTAPAKTDVEISLDGRPLEVKPLILAPGERRLEILTSLPRPTRNARGWLTARLSSSDALATDNVAYAVLPQLRPARVLLVTKGNPFLEKFLAVDNTLKFQLITPDVWTPELAGKFEVVIFDGTRPADFDLAAIQKSGGNFLFLTSTPFTSAASLDRPLVTDVDGVHPTTRSVSLQNLTIAKSAALSLPALDGWKFNTPLRSFENALFVTGEHAQQRIAALGFDVLESDLPLRVAFPLLMSNTLHWLAGEQTELARSVSAGISITLSDQQRMSAEPLISAPKAPAPPTVEHYAQPMRNGYYAIAEGDSTRWLAVNTFSTEESNLMQGDTISAVVSTPASTPSGTFASWSSVPLWQWLALLALALFTGEWWLFHRRRTE